MDRCLVTSYQVMFMTFYLYGPKKLKTVCFQFDILSGKYCSLKLISMLAGSISRSHSSRGVWVYEVMATSSSLISSCDVCLAAQSLCRPQSCFSVEKHLHCSLILTVTECSCVSVFLSFQRHVCKHSNHSDALIKHPIMKEQKCFLFPLIYLQ